MQQRQEMMMASAPKVDAKQQGVEQPKMHRIRITLNSTNLQAIERVCSELIGNAKKREYVVAGPVRMPRRTLRVTTRKSPCGEGTNTWDRFEMRIYKRLIDLEAPSDAMKDIINVNLEYSVDMEATITQE